MSEPNKKPNQIPESYSPVKPVILNIVKKIVESSPEIPTIEVYQAYREPFQVLGMENKTPNGTVDDWGTRWKDFFNTGSPEKIKPYQVEKPLLGLFCQSEEGFYNYLVGAVVSGVKTIPKGMFLAEFPATEYTVVTHEWVQTEPEAGDQVGRIVGYAHGQELQLPDGYEKYTDPVMFIESYNYEFDNNRFRFEVWLPIRKKV